ncbi:type VII secretion protein EssB/YukC [Bacillus thuringiensis]|uniref:type VII secretion protein EssB/YukC n=1 Tax=Bacillus thuringiensis TaxID=1428 RepID=UPI0011A572F8|nr:type VII secretion protein EssB/YukC [Bacillus thuringiensis]
MIIVFGDGTLEETATEYVYRFSKTKLKQEAPFDSIKQTKPYLLPCTFAEIIREDVILRYEKEPHLLSFSRIQQENEAIKRKVVSRLGHLFQTHQETTLLPIPENIFYNKKGEVKLMYQAMEHMPVTGFNRKDRLTHMKHLLTFAFSNESFEACMLQSVEMRNEFLQHIYQSTTWEALQELVKEPEETEEKQKKRKRNGSFAPFSSSLSTKLCVVLLTLSVSCNLYVITKDSIRPAPVNAKQDEQSENQKKHIQMLEQEKTKLQKQMQEKESEIKEIVGQLKIVIEENKKLQQKQETVPPAQ